MLLFPQAILDIKDESDRAFMEQIFIDFRDIMYFQAYSIMQNEMDAEDLITESWLRLCRKVKKLRELRETSICDLQRYIVRSIRNASLNLLKKKDRRREVFLERYDEFVDNIGSTQVPVDEEVMQMNDLAAYRLALKTLRYPYYDILMMKFLDEMDNAEIAAHLNIAKDSVRAYISTARRMAKDIVIKKRRDEDE